MNSITEDLNSVGCKRQCVDRIGSCRPGNDKSSFNVAPWLSILLKSAKARNQLEGPNPGGEELVMTMRISFPLQSETYVRIVGWLDGWVRCQLLFVCVHVVLSLCRPLRVVLAASQPGTRVVSCKIRR